MDTSWEILASLAAWHIWKARCTKALDGSQVHPSSTLASIWTDCILILMAIWASIQGVSEAATLNHVCFPREWKGSPFFSESATRLSWHFHPHLGFLLLLLEKFYLGLHCFSDWSFFLGFFHT